MRSPGCRDILTMVENEIFKIKNDKKGDNVMNKAGFNLKLVIVVFIIATIGMFQLFGTPAQAKSNTPITIYPSALKHIPGLEQDVKIIINTVKSEFKSQIATQAYHRVAVDAIDEDSDKKADYLYVYFMPKAKFSLEVSRITLGANYDIVVVENDYKLKTGDSSSEHVSKTEICNCPDQSVEVLVSSMETGIQTAVAGVNYAYNAAVSAGYTAHKLLGNDENSTNIDNWLCCPNLKYWGRIGHGLPNLIVVADGNLSSSYFSGLSSTHLQGKVLYWNSCQVFNDPMKSAVLNAGAGKFIGGICNLYIGSSEEVFKAWADKNFNHVSAPAGTSDEMCYWLTTCESSTGYPELGCHGCGGPDSLFPNSGSGTTYTLTTNTTGDGTISLSPSGGVYAAGTTVTLTANPGSGWIFGAWGGDLTGSTNPETLTMNENKSVTASFTQPSTPPVANFSANTTTVYEGQSVTFSDTSTNGPTSWSWTFTGGTPSSSTQQNPVVTYNTEGNYNVSLTVTNAAGSDTETKTQYITVNKDSGYCTVTSSNFSYEWIAGVAGGGINNTSGAAGYSDFTSYQIEATAGASLSISLTPGFNGSSYTEYWKIWVDYNKDGDFSDAGEEVYSGSGSSTVSASFTVSSSGDGLTRMRIGMRYGGAPAACGTNDYGETEDYAINIEPELQSPPVAGFTANNTTIVVGGSVTFTNQSTNNPTSYSWSFPGGTPTASTAVNPTVTYNTVGTYNVSLTATNGAGSDDEVKANYITVTPNVIEYCTIAGGNQGYEWIAGVNIANINNSTGASPYTDYTAQVANVTAGASVSVSLTPGFGSGAYNEYWTIYIDANKDGDFLDSGETVYTGSGNGVVSGSFTVPSSAAGQTRMRVVMSYNSGTASCGNFTYGEAEDYDINIQ